jgi:hypothetical protein
LEATDAEGGRRPECLTFKSGRAARNDLDRILLAWDHQPQ